MTTNRFVNWKQRFAFRLAAATVFLSALAALAACQTQQQHLADEEQMTADSYSDAAWNWNAWGPWGPGYGVGYGVGYGW